MPTQPFWLAKIACEDTAGGGVLTVHGSQLLGHGVWKRSAAKWRHLLVTDAKTGYDAICSDLEVLPSGRKITLDVGVLREGLMEPLAEKYMRWVPGSEMPGDGLAKWAHNRTSCRR
ncbi:unnamed protein product [Symbiodinium microadriaticum]|nr:unnamed protein product [Symbiodinium sp. KB8]CAE7276312.1 unnamed protein product [Symbiodinium microadriaticum]